MVGEGATQSALHDRLPDSGTEVDAVLVFYSILKYFIVFQAHHVAWTERETPLPVEGMAKPRTSFGEP